LAEIWYTIATEASIAVADEFVLALQQHFEPLRTFPNAGAPRPRLGRELRVVFHQPYSIYYRPLPDSVVVMRIVHGARDVTAIVKSGGFTDE
jgi:toxin ParE1/3/4